MIAADTNIVLRLFIQDDPNQSKQAAQLFADHTIWVSRTVLLECEWVLRSALQHSRDRIYEMMDTLIHLEGVVVEDYPLLYQCLESYDKGMDFADALHLHLANQENLDFYTFDKKLVHKAKAVSAKAQLLN
ncbi:MAG: type II toxin-antitoxin system VapC family toxin [Opitutales bacterium]